MSCEIARRLMETNDPALAAHVESCASCIIGANAPYYTAPPGLEHRIRQSLPDPAPQPAWWRWAAIAASLLLVASVATNVAMFRSRISGRQLTAEAVLSAHVRSLAGTHLIDVPSADQHTVKPWFNGRLDFSPAVKTLPGFPLLGGRLEYFDGHPAAALVYGRGKHIVNLFTWPARGAPMTEGNETRNGYHIQSWSAGGMAYWAVSDVNKADLRNFVSLYRQ